jgi:DNA-binding SARP family transcriptional activator
MLGGLEIQAPIVIYLLGQFSLVKAGTEIAVREGGKIHSLLGRLALRPHSGLHRENLMVALWPEREPRLASQSLNTLIYSVHRLLGDGIGGAPPVLQAGGSYKLNLEAGIVVDLAYFEGFAAEGDRQAQTGNEVLAAHAYRRAIHCYRGDLVDGGEIRALLERERLRSTYLTVLARLADYSFRCRKYDESLETALRLLLEDPCREDAHRLVMRCHVRRGERAQSLRQYRLCEEILKAEFEAVPEPVTKELFEQVRLDPSEV